MPRKQTALRPVQVDYVCDTCEKGVYRPTGVMLTSSPPKFPHKCTNCKEEKTFIEKYPTLRYCLEGEMINLEKYEQQPV